MLPSKLVLQTELCAFLCLNTNFSRKPNSSNLLRRTMMVVSGCFLGQKHGHCQNVHLAFTPVTTKYDRAHTDTHTHTHTHTHTYIFIHPSRTHPRTHAPTHPPTPTHLAIARAVTNGDEHYISLVLRTALQDIQTSTVFYLGEDCWAMFLEFGGFASPYCIRAALLWWHFVAQP